MAFRNLSVGVALSIAVAAPMLGCARDNRFTFDGVEYLSDTEREPTARAFLAQTVQPGMSLEQARRVLQHADAYCPPVTAGVLECMHASMQRPPGHWEQDVIWRIVVQGDGAGRVVSAHVERTVRGT
jgi:hypothetical protein